MVTQYGNVYSGKHDDTKPTGVPLNGREFHEMDTSKVYKYDADSGEWLPWNVLSNVDVTEAEDGQILQYDAEEEKWVPATINGGTGADTLTLSGQAADAKAAGDLITGLTDRADDQLFAVPYSPDLYVDSSNRYLYYDVTAGYYKASSSKAYIATRFMLVNRMTAYVGVQCTNTTYKMRAIYFDDTGYATTTSGTGRTGYTSYSDKAIWFPANTPKLLLSFRKADSSAISAEDLAAISSSLVLYTLRNEKAWLNDLETNAIDLLPYFADYYSGSSGNISFTWNNGNTECSVSGSASSGSVPNNVLFFSYVNLPLGVFAGKRYIISFEVTDKRIYMDYGFYNSSGSLINSGSWIKNSATQFRFTVPTAAVGMYLRLRVAGGQSADGTISGIKIYNVPDVPNQCINNSQMRSFGNSILTGALYPEGSLTTLAEFPDAPYGCVATALGIRQSDVYHSLYSSTGLMYDAGEGSFLTNIKAANLVSYDYLLTHFWTADINNYPLGSMTSTKADGSLAGAVLDLLDYIQSNNPLCHLILVSVPPVSTTHSGDTVFTEDFNGGYSIADLDELMHQMAETFHFTYIDWQDMGLSYIYQQFTYNNSNVHAKEAKTYRHMGLYLGRHLI